MLLQSHREAVSRVSSNREYVAGGFRNTRGERAKRNSGRSRRSDKRRRLAVNRTGSGRSNGEGKRSVNRSGHRDVVNDGNPGVRRVGLSSGNPYYVRTDARRIRYLIAADCDCLRTGGNRIASADRQNSTFVAGTGAGAKSHLA